MGADGQGVGSLLYTRSFFTFQSHVKEHFAPDQGWVFKGSIEFSGTQDMNKNVPSS